MIWGNHSATQVVDFTHATLQGRPIEEKISDRVWLEKIFVEMVQKRGAEILQSRGKSSAASAASAVIDTVKNLIEPTKGGGWFSIGLLSDGNSYGIKEGLLFSFPCRSRGNGKVDIVSGLDWDSFIREKIHLTEKELIEERKVVQDLLER